MAKKEPQVLRLKVTLEDVDPAPWREIEIRSDKTLPHLHDAIQAAFLWYDMHLWDFEIGDRKYQMKNEDFWIEPMFGPPVMEVTTKKLEFFLNKKVPPVIYTYDIGDEWAHRVELVSKRPVVPNEPLPRFVGGQWATPPEDIGGPPMYEVFKEARGDAKHQNTIGRRKLDTLTGLMMKSTPMLSVSSSRNCRGKRHGGHHVGLWRARSVT